MPYGADWRRYPSGENAQILPCTASATLAEQGWDLAACYADAFVFARLDYGMHLRAALVSVVVAAEKIHPVLHEVRL